jgi:hypothetical protein
MLSWTSSERACGAGLHSCRPKECRLRRTGLFETTARAETRVRLVRFALLRALVGPVGRIRPLISQKWPINQGDDLRLASIDDEPRSRVQRPSRRRTTESRYDDAKDYYCGTVPGIELSVETRCFPTPKRGAVNSLVWMRAIRAARAALLRREPRAQRIGA